MKKLNIDRNKIVDENVTALCNIETATIINAAYFHIL